MTINDFKREVSALLVDSASWNDRPFEEFKDVKMEDFLADYIFDGFLYNCLEKDESLMVCKADEFVEHFNEVRNTLWYSGVLKTIYDEKPRYDLDRCYDYLEETTWEMCPECEEEVELEMVLKMQVCPNCGKPIAPCSICDHNLVDCSKCPIGCNSLAR